MNERENMLEIAKRISKQNSYRNYMDSLRKIIGNQESYLYQPQYFFYTVNDNLRCLGTNIELDMEEKLSQRTLTRFTKAYFPAIPYNEVYVEDFIKCMYNYLSGIELSPYEKVLLNFKWQCGLFALPYLDNTNCMTYNDNKIFIIDTDSNGVRRYTILTDRYMKELVENNGGKYIASESVKKKLADELINILNKETEFEESDIYSVNFAEGKLSYNPITESAKFEPMERIHSYRGFIALGTQTKVPSNAVKKVLADMTDKSLKTFNLIAELIARLMAEKLPSEYVWNICGPGKNKFGKLLSLLCDKNESTSIYDKKGKKLIETLNIDNALHKHLQINNIMISKKLFCEINHSVIDKLVKGTKVAKEDDIFLPCSKLNYCPLIAIVQYETDYESFFKKIKYKTVEIENFDIQSLTPADISWMKLYITAYGLNLIHNKNDLLDPDVIIDELISEFINKFCHREKGRYIRTKEFCEYFKQYCTAIGANNIELLSHTTKLTEKIAESGLETKIVRKADNKKCFMDIEVSEEKLSDFSKSKPEITVAEKRFEQVIDSIADLV